VPKATLRLAGLTRAAHCSLSALPAVDMLPALPSALLGAPKSMPMPGAEVLGAVAGVVPSVSRSKRSNRHRVGVFSTSAEVAWLPAALRGPCSSQLGAVTMPIVEPRSSIGQDIKAVHCQA
jgi:hypothetical protein